MATRTVAGPFFEDLVVGQCFDGAPAVTLTEGHAAQHQAILGSRLRLPLDHSLCQAVTGNTKPLAHPGLLWDVAIGQSTEPTARVVGNLFYRGLAIHRAAHVGDTLRTRATVVGLKQNAPRPGRVPSGLAVLRVRCEDQQGRSVLDFLRCAMLPLSDPELDTGQADDIGSYNLPLREEELSQAVLGWDLEALRAVRPEGEHFAALVDGEFRDVVTADVVSSAPELARLSLNLAAIHTDERATGCGRRLVYGGHTIGLATAQLSRAWPDAVYVLAWEGCDHLGPVFEGDSLSSTLIVRRRTSLPSGGGLAHLHCRVTAHRGTPEDVLDWRPIVLFA